MAVERQPKTNLKPAKAEVTVIGVVSEKDIQFSTDKEGREMAEANITVKTSDVNFVKFHSTQYKQTKTGTESKSYLALETINKEYKTISQDGNDADIVKVNAELNLYTSVKGVDCIGYKGKFFNRETGKYTKDDFSAGFDVEVYIRSFSPEIDRKTGEETGRLLIRGWVPNYDGVVQPIVLVADDEYGVASAIRDTLKPGDTAEFFGTIINNRVETVREIPVAIGKPRVERKIEYKNDLLIESVSAAYGSPADDLDRKPYDKETIELSERIREEGKNKNSSAPAPTNSTASTGASRNASGFNW